MAEVPDEKCGYTWPDNHNIGNKPNRQSCCYRDSLPDTEHCAWHADPENTDHKTIEALRDARVASGVREQTSPYGELLDGAVLRGLNLGDRLSLAGVSLQDADLSNTRLKNANLQNANLRGANLQDARLSSANLSGVELQGGNARNTYLRGAKLVDALLQDVDFTSADFQYADLSEANLGRATIKNAFFRDVDLSDTYLWRTDLTEADLTEATLTDTCFRSGNMTGTALGNVTFHNTDLRGATLADVAVNGSTSVETLREENDFDPDDWDATARAYHDLKTAFAARGLVGKARQQHVRERRARALEARAVDGRFNRRYIGSLVSRYFTGYGVRVRTLVTWMLALFVLSTAWYMVVGIEDTLVGNVSYSVLAFTVAPPHVPSGLFTQLVMMIETFLGTLSIVLLGYVLGNRERF